MVSFTTIGLQGFDTTLSDINRRKRTTLKKTDYHRDKVAQRKFSTGFINAISENETNRSVEVSS